MDDPVPEEFDAAVAGVIRTRARRTERRHANSAGRGAR